MHTQYTPHFDQLPPSDQFIAALLKLDEDAQFRVKMILNKGIKEVRWLDRKVKQAINQQIAEQQDLDAWIEREAAADLARCADPYGMSKMGDGAYWMQS